MYLFCLFSTLNTKCYNCILYTSNVNTVKDACAPNIHQYVNIAYALSEIR